MTAGWPRFSPDELPIDGGRVTASDLAASIAVARRLGALAAAPALPPSPGFSSRVMAAVAAEPAPQPVLAFGRALAAGRIAAMVAAVGDAWRVVASPGRPAGVRAQALALVLLVLLAFGSVVGMAGAAVGLFDPPGPNRSMPTRPAVVAPSPSHDPREITSPSPTSPTENTSPAPGGSSKPAVTTPPTSRPTTRPIATPRPTETAEPSETDGGSDDGHGGETPAPSDGGSPE